MLLSELKPGEYGLVKKITGTGALHRRLLSMGLLPGAIVRVVRVSPLRDPIEYEIRGFFISLRRQEASFVEVDRVVPLSLVPRNSKVRVVFIDGGVSFVQNMGTMGISVGKLLQVIQPCCPMQVQTDAGIFTLGRGMAYRVFVR